MYCRPFVIENTIILDIVDDDWSLTQFDIKPSRLYPPETLAWKRKHPFHQYTDANRIEEITIAGAEV